MWKRSSHEDRLSALPDALLLHILSFMDMRNVVRSSILSKRWRYLWTSVPTLRFVCREGSLEKVGKFVEWVNEKLLWSNNTNAIEKLIVDLLYYQRFASDVDNWLRFAAERHVRDLSLRVLGSLPQSLCCNSSLTRLSIEDCDFMPERSLSWKSLKTLKISWVRLNEGIISQILSGSPGLEYLKFDDCRGLNRLDINLESLKELVISSMVYNDPLEISAPNLQILQISGWCGESQIRLENVSSLRRVKLTPKSGGLRSADDYGERCDRFIELFRSLHHVEELELGVWCIQVQLLLEVKGLQLPLSRLKCLKLNANINKYDIPGILSLLRCSSNLEKLVVTMTKEGFGYPISLTLSNQVERYWSLETRFDKFPLPHLKTVKLFGFNELGGVDGRILTLLQVLEENAKLVGGAVITVGERQMSTTSRFGGAFEYQIRFLKLWYMLSSRRDDDVFRIMVHSSSYILRIFPLLYMAIFLFFYVCSGLRDFRPVVWNVVICYIFFRIMKLL